jgi:ATP-dependent DNA ligase
MLSSPPATRTDCPDFGALYRISLCIWAFDLLTINEKDLRPLALDERRARLHRLVQSKPTIACAISDRTIAARAGKKQNAASISGNRPAK